MCITCWLDDGVLPSYANICQWPESQIYIVIWASSHLGSYVSQRPQTLLAVPGSEFRHPLQSITLGPSGLDLNIPTTPFTILSTSCCTWALLLASCPGHKGGGEALAQLRLDARLDAEEQEVVLAPQRQE